MYFAMVIGPLSATCSEFVLDPAFKLDIDDKRQHNLLCNCFLDEIWMLLLGPSKERMLVKVEEGGRNADWGAYFGAHVLGDSLG